MKRRLVVASCVLFCFLFWILVPYVLASLALNNHDQPLVWFVNHIGRPPQPNRP